MLRKHGVDFAEGGDHIGQVGQLIVYLILSDVAIYYERKVSTVEIRCASKFTRILYTNTNTYSLHNVKPTRTHTHTSVRVRVCAYIGVAQNI